MQTKITKEVNQHLNSVHLEVKVVVTEDMDVIITLPEFDTFNQLITMAEQYQTVYEKAVNLYDEYQALEKHRDHIARQITLTQEKVGSTPNELTKKLAQYQVQQDRVEEDIRRFQMTAKGCIQNKFCQKT